MSNAELIKQIKNLGQSTESALNGKELWISGVVGRFKEASERHPHDPLIRRLESVLEGKLKREGNLSTISQREMQNLYNEMSGSGNLELFREELGDLLIESGPSSVASHNPDFIKGLRADGEELNVANQHDVSALSALWSGDPSDRVLKSAFVESGRRGVEIELESLGFANPTVAVAAKDLNFVVYSAEIDNRKGRIPFLIPAEIKLGSVLMPSVFVAGDSFEDLNADNIKAYTDDHTSLGSASPKGVLDTLRRLTATVNGTKNVKEASMDNSFDDILPHGDAIFSSTLGHTDSSLNSINEIDDKVAQVEMPKALVGISDALVRETLAEAGLSYSRELVLAAKQVVSNELKVAGIAHDKLSIESEFSNGITIATNISGKGGKRRIEVPVEIVNEKVLMPGGFTSGAMAGKFNEEGLKSFANTADGAEFDPFLNDKYDMNFNELHRYAMKKAAYGNFAEATEVLSIISDKFGHEYHKMAHDDLMSLMRVGYQKDVKPLSAMEAFAKQASDAAQERASRINMTNNAMLFYPGE